MGYVYISIKGGPLTRCNYIYALEFDNGYLRVKFPHGWGPFDNVTYFEVRPD